MDVSSWPVVIQIQLIISSTHIRTFIILSEHLISQSNYYKHKGDTNHEQYKEDDYILQTQIDIVNHYINDTNRVLHSYTPYFSEDLVHSKRNSRYSLRTKYKYKFTLYTDGIHPKPLLAKLWLARMCRLVHDFWYWILLTLTFGWHYVYIYNLFFLCSITHGNYQGQRNTGTVDETI